MVVEGELELRVKVRRRRWWENSNQSDVWMELGAK
jgi:hypothetical protein